MASNRRRFEIDGGGEEGAVAELERDEIRLEVHDAEEAVGDPELGEEWGLGPEASPAELPVCWIWSQLGAVLTKADGTEQEVADGTLLAAYGWVPGDAGSVAVNLGEKGKWFIRLDQWTVYRREG